MLMTLGEHIINNRRPIDHLKLQNLRKIIVDRPISTVQPTRTNSRGMNSQVVIEKQLAMCKKWTSIMLSDKKNIQMLFYFR